ncbi:hypothetical protein AMS68_007764 [Peltaster fructicola]|uniref:Glutaredoxin domain-containing protein n=1 Tax=Peltaster fructicola TaxID=286661 RepID=A0A6H0Y5C1_9PEZI|nr:hypothetical protein AMS68_007764 [Peltaster fructicola]
MPGARRMRLSALLIILFILILLYITTGRRATYSSPFYTRTVAAINERKTAEAQADLLAEEKARQERITRVQDEHEIAMGKADPDKLKIIESSKESGTADSNTPDEGQRSVAGRKLMKDGKVVVDETGKGSDGVAKVGGNIQAKQPAEGAEKETDDELKAKTEIDSILKKGPIIVFSKSYCPYSKKAKDILQNVYTIVPPPYVVELDEHEIGGLLQSSLKKTTGRGTVPNILVNGKSIGGGDDIQRLHTEGKLIDTIKNFGGKRIMEVKLADADSKAEAKPRRRRV